MVTLNTAPDIILDLIFLNLNEEDLHETLRVSKSWFWASIRRIKKLKITLEDNPLKSMIEFYNNQRSSCEEEIDWTDLFKHLVLDELIVIRDKETISYLVNNGCNTAKLTIKISRKATPVTLASLKRVTRLQSYEFCTFGGNYWHPFIFECLKSSDCEFDPSKQCPIEKITLNSSGWNTETAALHSVTKLSLCRVTIEFLRTLVDHCPNLEELHCSWGYITQDWHQVFPANIKRIELHDVRLNTEITTIVEASTDSARHLLPYLCQNWESVEKFHCDGNIHLIDRTVYQAFPQEREEIFMCQLFNMDINLANPLLECRKLRVKCDGRKASTLIIPASKSVKFCFNVERDFKFSPRDVCLQPDKVVRLALSLMSWEPVTTKPFGPNSFEGFYRLTTLTLSHVSALSIKMALDQCPSIKKLKLKQLKAYTIWSIPRRSSYANVCELVLTHCEEPIQKVFKVFPCLSKFKHSGWRRDEIRKKTTEWLWTHLIAEDKRFGLVFEITDGIRYMVSDDLQSSLKETQKLLNEYLHSGCHLKGFKLIPRVATQKLIYMN